MITIKTRLRNILIELLKEDAELKNIEGLDFNKSFKELGLNSIFYIKLIVKFEAEFRFEFDDDKLNFESFNSINDLFNFIENSIGNK